jgi:hypothetical protein
LFAQYIVLLRRVAMAADEYWPCQIVL